MGNVTKQASTCFSIVKRSKGQSRKRPILAEVQNGEKITPKQWKTELQSLQAEYDSIGKE